MEILQRQFYRKKISLYVCLAYILFYVSELKLLVTISVRFVLQKLLYRVPNIPENCFFMRGVIEQRWYKRKFSNEIASWMDGIAG